MGTLWVPAEDLLAGNLAWQYLSAGMMLAACHTRPCDCLTGHALSSVCSAPPRVDMRVHGAWSIEGDLSWCTLTCASS